ncbi:MAG: enterobactin ABC transporter permease [Rhodobacteraceae bacterium]|nr:enterobactin ABC transporter permease [Paracoccaceae bacterium]
MAETARRIPTLPVLPLLGGVLALGVVLFLGWNLSGPVGFILELRVTKLVALVLVGAGIGMATVLFQTLAGSRLLTPGIVGFDALFVFLQTLLVISLGGLGYTMLPPTAKFLAETGILIVAAMALFGVLLKDGARDMTRMILAGVILGVLLRGLAALGQRTLDPSEFAVVQQAVVASFNTVPKDQLAIAALVLLIATTLSLRLAGRMDVAALGERTARSLGLNYRRTALQALALVAAMSAVSTALVGPITFLGLLASSLAHHVAGTHRHAVLLPAAALIGAAILVYGQFVFERLLSMQSSLALLVEFAGGVLFLALVLRRAR